MVFKYRKALSMYKVPGKCLVKANGISEAFLPVTLRQGPALWLPGHGAQTPPEECGCTPCGASSEPPFSIVGCVKAKFGHRLPPRMDEPTSRHASVVLQAVSMFRAGRLAPRSGRFQIQCVLLPRGPQGLSCRRCVYRWNAAAAFPSFSGRSSAASPAPEP